MGKQEPYLGYGEGNGFDDGRDQWVSDGGPSDLSVQAANNISHGLANIFLQLGPPPTATESTAYSFPNPDMVPPLEEAAEGEQLTLRQTLATLLQRSGITHPDQVSYASHVLSSVEERFDSTAQITLNQIMDALAQPPQPADGQTEGQ